LQLLQFGLTISYAFYLQYVVAFEICISHMDCGEVCELITDAKYAYGELGRLVRVVFYNEFDHRVIYVVFIYHRR